jgi:RNA polymerase sigma-70 factor (ECF subfamily)
MSDNHVKDLHLVQKALLEDIDAFGELINRYQEKLQRYVLRISHFSVEEAEEILQEVFLKAWKNLRDFDQSLAFSSWIYRITHNHTISSFRKAKSRGQDKQVGIDDQLFHLKSKELELGEQLDKKIHAKKVREALEKMPENYKEILILRYFEDKSYEDISDILKKPMGTVATLVNRAKKKFRENYQP